MLKDAYCGKVAMGQWDGPDINRFLHFRGHQIWNRLENFVPLHCQLKESRRRTLRIKIARINSRNCAH